MALLIVQTKVMKIQRGVKYEHFLLIVIFQYKPCLILNTLDLIPLQNRICEVYEFRCGLGQCISRNDVCNGYANCADKSDEEPKMCKVCSYC